LRPPPGPPTGTVTINAPAKLEGLATGGTDALGRPLRVACATCHSLRKPERLPTSTADLVEFHAGLSFRHGDLSCASCHVIGDQRSLHRADGSLIAMRDAMQLCRQCHGPQARDYDHGAHGGMTGYWDLSAGNRSRNNCVDCHDPHVPAFLPTRPVLLPRDRGRGTDR
jgi:formate-dependent nitrite reductase cytochrome c552 subunit